MTGAAAGSSSRRTAAPSQADAAGWPALPLSARRLCSYLAASTAEMIFDGINHLVRKGS